MKVYIVSTRTSFLFLGDFPLIVRTDPDVALMEARSFAECACPVGGKLVEQGELDYIFHIFINAPGIEAERISFITITCLELDGLVRNDIFEHYEHQRQALKEFGGKKGKKA